ncbi:LLM class flavin-dependent oxidoreductase [Ravibacter arvi]|uniref:LLM class flavin-dependent oxidoreductase n=1 Tax=Ravibacter arvi TaxID=2051041 RepID=A0ABP8LND4_9BACT
MPIENTPLSVLELAVVAQGGNAGQAIADTVSVAKHVEQLGYRSIWLAEHHNMQHVASSATAVLIGHIAGHTHRIHVGSGGIMLPNHAPLMVAEQFGTLESIYPGRIELGLGRAPGTDQTTALALRRSNLNTAFSFPADVQELMSYFKNDDPDVKVRAFPGEGLKIPFYMLGSSTDSAHLAAHLGLPYAFAAHFAPSQLRSAVNIYRNEFRPSEQLAEPHVMVCVNAFGADTDAEAYRLATSLFQMFIGMVTNRRAPLPPPVDSLDAYWNEEIRQAVMRMAACTFIGDRKTLRSQFADFHRDVHYDELIVTSHIFDHQAKLRSFDVIRQAFS